MADEEIVTNIIVTLIFAAGSICFLYWWCKRQKEIEAARKAVLAHMQQALATIPDFIPSSKFFSTDLLTAISIDRTHRTICLLTPTDLPQIISFSQIISCTLETDEDVTITTSIGDVQREVTVASIFYDDPETIGAITADRNVEKTINKIDLTITLNSLHQPIFTLNFFSSIITAEQDLQLAKQWEGMMNVIIHQNKQR